MSFAPAVDWSSFVSLLIPALVETVTPLSKVDDVVSFFDRSDCESLEEYLEAFTHTIALMQTYENLERISFEAAEDMHMNGINLYESRYAPFFSVNEHLSPSDVLKAINVI